jgi:hypothetical protein
MNPVRCALVVLSILVAAFAATAPAGAKTALPNLVVTKVSKPPKTKTLGSKIKLVVKVADKGGPQASASKLGLYLGKGRKHTKKDKRLKRVKVKALASGKSQKLKLKALLPKKTKPGTYRLFACADDTRKVKEAKEGDNCRGSKKLRLVANTRAAATIPPGQSPPPAAAFSMSDGLDWGFVENAEQDSAEAGDPVTVNLTAANGIPGQAGYVRTDTAPEGFRSGNATTLDYSGATNSGDDGQVTVPLPFDFPFGGIREDKISVSTNGWVSFRSPAWDYWNDVQPEDYRGVQAVVGELERGIMPYWDDLDVREQGAGTGTVTEVVAPDNSWVAFQWDLGQHGGGTPRRTFQLVLFPDGSFRFDYPGKNEAGGNEAFVGYSLGTGASSADVVAENTESVPASSLLVKPKALPASGTTDPGNVSTTLPKGSTFDSADPGCTLASEPTMTSTGLVSCAVPSLAPGQQTARNVTYSMPPDAPGQTSPANFRYLGTYTAGSVKLTDGDEVDALSTGLPATAIDVKTVYPGGAFEPEVPTNFEVSVKPKNGGLDEPTVEFDLEGATFSSAKIAGEPIECTPPGGGSATCVLPSGTHASKVEVTVVPTNSSSIDLEVTARALNAPDAVGGIGIINL